MHNQTQSQSLIAFFKTTKLSRYFTHAQYYNVKGKGKRASNEHAKRTEVSSKFNNFPCSL